MKHALAHNRRGFTLVEMVIAFTVLSLILGTIGMVSLAGRDAYQQGVQAASLQVRARRTLQRVADELTGGIGMTLTPIPSGSFVTGVDFRKCLGYAAGAPLQSTLTSLRLEPDPNDANDGIDNDTDGLVDEGQLVLVRNSTLANEVRIVLVRNVAVALAGETANGTDDNGNGLQDEAGFCVSTDNGTGTVRLRLTVEGRDPKNNLVSRTVETSVHLRN